VASIFSVSFGQILDGFAGVAATKYGDRSSAPAPSNLSAIEFLCSTCFAHQFDKPISRR